jgi:hypothetical protein
MSGGMSGWRYRMEEGTAVAEVERGCWMRKRERVEVSLLRLRLLITGRDDDDGAPDSVGTPEA